MADISKLSRLLNGIQRQVDLASNTLVVSTIKIGGGSGTELSKTDLDTLIGGSADAGSLHHHDGQYFTETELGSVADGASGASLIGVDQTPAFTNISGANVQAVLESIDTALGTAGVSEFADDEFKVFGDVDGTKKMRFEVDGLTTATERTLTIQDKNIIVAGTASETFSGTTTVDLLRVDGQAHSPIQAQSASADDEIDWDDSNVQRITLDQASTTLTFANGKDGGQYLLIIDQDATGGRSVTFPGTVDFIGPAPTIQQGASERTIVSFFYDPSKSGSEYQGLSSNDILAMANGGTGANLSPAAGAVVYSDNDSMELSAIGTAGQVLQSGGTGAPTWLTLAGGDGMSYSAGSFAVDLASDPGLEFNSAQLQVKVDPAGALLRLAAGLHVNTDDSSIEISSNALRVKADGIDQTHIQLANATFLQALNSGASSTDVIGINGSDDIVFGSLPKDATVPTDAAHLTNKAYVDAQITAAAAGLDPKESVTYATLDAIIGTYAAAGGTNTSGEFTAVDFTDVGDFDLDGGAVAVGDRILVKNQADAKQNGIYIVEVAGASGTMERAEDQDGFDPAAEVSGGNFTFVENGASYAGSGWVVVGDGALTLNTDNIVWTQFSATGAFSGGDGIDITSNVISVDLATNSGLEFATGKLQVKLLASGGLKNVAGELAVEPADFAGQGLKDDGSDNLALNFDALTSESAVAADDEFAFADASDSANHKKVTWAQMLTKQAGAGLSLNVDVLDVNTGDGIEISSDAVALNLDGITATATGLESADLFAIHDDSGAGNAKISVANMLGDGLGLTSTKIAVQLEAAGGIEMDTAADLKLAFDALAAETAIATGDFLAFADISAAGDGDHKKITMANLLTQLAGDGLGVSGAGLAVKVQTAGGIQIDTDELELDFDGLAEETSADSADFLAFYDDSAGVHKKISRANLIGDLSVVAEAMAAGETFEANTVHAVRMATSGETANRVYKGDFDASSSDDFYIIGLAINNTGSAISAGSNIKVVKLGAQALESGDLTLVAGDIGKPFYLADGTGNLTLTAPSGANEAVVKLGTIRNNVGSIVEVQIQVMGVN